MAEKPSSTLETAIFGAGCFWCVEPIFREVEGVVSAECGYAGGAAENPTYEQICTGTTGHAEVVRVQFDPAKVSFETLLQVFWKVHDPTTLNRQGADAGTQYRSSIFPTTDRQRELAEKYKKELDASGAWSQPIVTTIEPGARYWRAEEYHQDYFSKNPGNRYCQFNIPPKLEKFRKVFPALIRKKGG